MHFTKCPASLLGASAHCFAGACSQESEGEEAEASRVTLAQDLGKGNTAGHASRVRLHEVGPRLELEVVKVGRLFLALPSSQLFQQFFGFSTLRVRLNDVLCMPL